MTERVARSSERVAQTGALLIGFRYNDSTQPLPGTEEDLSYAIEYAQRIKCNPLVIVSDIPGNNFSLEIFITCRSSILERFKQCQRMIIYYSGHGTPRSWLLPDGRTIELEQLAKEIQALRIPEMVWILDSCCAWHLDLPYLLDNSYYRRIREAIPSSRILCLLATQDLAWSTVSGSRFSRLFFSLIREGVRYLPTLVFRMGGLRVYSSRPHPLFLWEWLYGECYRLSIEWIDNTIRLSLHNSQITTLNGLAAVGPRFAQSPTASDLLVNGVKILPP